jgi:hypothetical protein
MSKYKYKFCDGTVSEVEVSNETFALLKRLDRQERKNNLRHKRGSVPLAGYIRKEGQADVACDRGDS